MFTHLLQISLSNNDSISQKNVVTGIHALPDYVTLPNICLVIIIIVMLFGTYMYSDKIRKIKNASRLDPNFMNRIRDYIHDGKIEAAHSLCLSTDSPAGRLIDKGIGRIGNPLSDLYSSMDCMEKIEYYKLEKNIQLMLSLASVAIVIGILGSVFTLDFNSKLIAPLDVEAGLIAGLLIYLAYHQLISRLAGFNFSMRRIISDFMDILNEPVK